jgi:hypothetical protein
MSKISCLAVSLAVAGCAADLSAQDPGRTPWRTNDGTIVQVCIDAMDRSAPNQLIAEEISRATLGRVRLELVGYTLSDRPIYQGAVGHPLKFQTLLLQLPGTNVKARIDSPGPAFLQSAIEAWRDAPSPTVCTGDERAGLNLVNGRPVSGTVVCPEIGMSLSFKVISRLEFSASSALQRARGPVVYNGLRGCRESVYKK